MIQRLFIILALLFSLTGCEFLHRNTVGLFYDSPPLTESTDTVDSFSSTQEDDLATSSTTTVGIEKFEQDENSSKSLIEIVWEIPKEPVDGFLIHYGYQKNKLEKVVRLQSSDIEKYEDPRYGFVYRYKLKDVPPNQSVFVALATFQGDATSELSAVFEVTPKEM